MNWNGQRETLDFLIRSRIEPERQKELQNDFNSRRRARVVASLSVRPFIVNLRFEMAAAGQVSPYRAITPQLNFDWIITGAKSDADLPRNIVLRRTEDEKPIAYVGDNQNLYLTTDEIAGLTTTVGGGQLGTFYLPQPLTLYKNNRLAVEIYKPDATASPVIINLALVGLRVFPSEYGDLLLDPAERKRLDWTMQAREAPRTVFLKQSVNFDSAGIGGEARNLLTPQVAEPLMIRGIRTTLRNSLIEGVRIEGEPNWMPGLIPIWALAAENDLLHDNYQWFSRPIYLRTNQAIEIGRIRNSIDGVIADAQTGNTITWICETV